jgi:hypothetical protein
MLIHLPIFRFVKTVWGEIPKSSPAYHSSLPPVVAHNIAFDIAHDAALDIAPDIALDAALDILDSKDTILILCEGD